MGSLLAPMLVLLAPLTLYGCWDAWCRYLKHKEHLAGMRRSEETEILQNLRQLTEMLVSTEAAVEASIEKNRAVLKGFIDSMTDLVKISEEDKQMLQNRLVASKLGKK